MKRCHDNNGAAIYVGRAATVHNPLFFVHSIVKYLNRNVSIGQLLQHISKCIIVCSRSRPKNDNKKFVRLHNHCLLSTMVSTAKNNP